MVDLSIRETLKSKIIFKPMLHFINSFVIIIIIIIIDEVPACHIVSTTLLGHPTTGRNFSVVLIQKLL